MPTVIEVSVLAIILVTYLMILLDVSVMIAALRRIRMSLGFSATGLSWVQSAYTLAFGGLLLLGARAGDILGRRRMYMTGLAIFTAASMVAGLAQSTAWLLAARALQGVGAAILAPSTLALLTTSFSEGTERTRADVRGHRQHWHQHRTRSRRHPHGCVLLALRVLHQGPIGVALMPTAPRYLAETERRPARLDPAGAISSTLGMTAFVYGIVRSAATGWSDPGTVGALTAGVLLLAGFVLNERRAAQAIMRLRLFASRQRSGAFVARILFIGGLFGFLFFMTQYLQGVSGYSPIGAGMAFLPMTLVAFPVAFAVPRLTQRLGNAGLLTAGLAVALVGMAWLSRLSPGTPNLTGIALPMVVLGIGQGVALSPVPPRASPASPPKTPAPPRGLSTSPTNSAAPSDSGSSSPFSPPSAMAPSAPATFSRTASLPRSPRAR